MERMVFWWIHRLLTVASLFSAVTLAERDTDYYFPGFKNPNTGKNMYWKDSVNILQDLDQFDALYVTYHRCVWSKYGSRYGSGEDYEYEEPDDDNEANADEDDGIGCGSRGGEYFWYMGRAQCFKAQVAYSLYGVLKGKTGTEEHGSLCHKNSYINSFFTTYGVESFGGPLGLDTAEVNSQCEKEGEQGGSGDNGNYDDVAADDDYLDDAFQYYNFADYTSTGIGCSAQGTFVQDQYTGAFCKGRNYLTTLDTLDSFNSAIQTQACTQIYSSTGNQNVDAQDRQLEQEEYNFQDMEAVRILSFSKSCSLRQYPHDCPDPYNLKKKYANRMERATRFKTGAFRNTSMVWMYLFSVLSLIGGFFCISAAYLLKRNAFKHRGASSSIHEIRKAKSVRRKAWSVQRKPTSAERKASHRCIQNAEIESDPMSVPGETVAATTTLLTTNDTDFDASVDGKKKSGKKTIFKGIFGKKTSNV